MYRLVNVRRYQVFGDVDVTSVFSSLPSSRPFKEPPFEFPVKIL